MLPISGSKIMGLLECPLGRPFRMPARHRNRILAATAATVLAAFPANAQSVAEFYRGKSINLIIGFSVGGGYDLYARVLARYMSRHIPGNPTIVPQNMTGAGSMRAAQFIYSVAPKDGLTFGTFSRMSAINPLVDNNFQFVATKFSWLGSVTNDVTTCMTWHTSPVKTYKDFLEKPSILGAQAPGSEIDIFASLHKTVLGANVRLSAGYPGTNEIMLAMERGEVDGICGLAWTTVKAQRANWIAEKKINVLIQNSIRKEADLANVPMIMDQTADREKQQILKLFVATHQFARPFAAPPDIPADRREALVAAFAATVKDPEFLAEAQRRDMEVAPVSAKAMSDMLVELYATPKDVLSKAAAAIAR
jgi:tripartite-type tricarboxylate transporter receptor subunit TctC